MGNQEHQEQSTDLESEILSEEPPSFEKQPNLLSKVFDANVDRIDAAGLLANAEIDLSASALCVGSHMEHEQKTWTSSFMFETPLETLIEAELDLLSDEEVLCYLQAEGINCDVFIDKNCQLITSKSSSVV